MEFLNGTGTIEEKTDKTTKKGEPFFKLIIDGKTYNSFDREEAFEQIKAGNYPAGTQVNFDYTETTSGEYTYKNLVKLYKTTTTNNTTNSPSGPVSKVPIPTIPANRTGTQIARMNALTNAIGFCNLNKEVLAMNLKDGTSLNQSISEDTMLLLAVKFEKWVTR